VAVEMDWMGDSTAREASVSEFVLVGDQLDIPVLDDPISPLEVRSVSYKYLEVKVFAYHIRIRNLVDVSSCRKGRIAVCYTEQSGRAPDHIDCLGINGPSESLAIY
jgi:hypothetical protein